MGRAQADRGRRHELYTDRHALAAALAEREKYEKDPTTQRFCATLATVPRAPKLA